jgi:hypothetical protein
VPTTPLTEWRFLNTARLSRIIGTLAAKLEIERPLNFLRRLPLVPAFNDELIGRFTGKVFAADVVADDQKANVQEGITLDIFSHTIPNIKIGQKLDQRLLDRIAQLEEQRGSIAGEDALADWENQLAENLLLAVRWQMNAMAAAMMLDTWSYDRFGIQLSGATWGMPSNLKVTPGTAWSVAATATPISDVFSLQQVAWLNYGITYDTMTMGLTNFNQMVSTTEFANKATLNVGAPAAFLLTPAALRTLNLEEMKNLAGRILNINIVLDEHQTRVKNADGTSTTTKTLPLNKVLLSRAADEGNAQTWDFANGVVTESRGEVPGLAANSRGPVAYYAPVSHDWNPPGYIAWAVAKAFPRKFVPEASAVLTVG